MKRFLTFLLFSFCLISRGFRSRSRAQAVAMSLATFFLLPSLKAQDTLLNYFTATDNNHESVLIRFEIKSGNTCNGINIYRSVDDITFTLLYTISGVCGSSTSATAYSYEDENPVSNQTNYYKLEFGNNPPTSSVSVFFVELNDFNYFIYPNPVITTTKIYFDNSAQEDAEICLVNGAGQIVLQNRINTDFWEPNLSDLASGTYFFSIYIDGRITKGKLLKF